MARRVFLSPHLDDAVLSCGGVITRQVSQGEHVVVVTLFAGDPPPGPVSAFATALHARWELAADPVASRREEDQRACGQLGARAVHLDFPEAIYRRGITGQALYASEEAIFSAPHREEQTLPAELAERLRVVIPTGTRVYCPLALGGHIDHRLVRLAAEAVWKVLWYYQDLPYAARGGRTPPEFTFPSDEQDLCRLDSREIRRWTSAVAAYGSQLSTFWGSETRMQRELHRFHDARGGIPLLKP